MYTLPVQVGSGVGRRGFALPAAILAIVVVGVLVTGGIQIATQESRIGVSTERASQAFYVAETGMNQVLATFDVATSDLALWGAPQVVTGTTTQGAWSSEIRRVDNQLFLIRTTGTVPTTRGGTAQRELAMMARQVTVQLEPPAALLTMGTVRVQGSAQIRGNDQIPAGWGAEQCPDPLENLPGVVTNVGGTVETGGQGSVTGTPSGHVTDPNVSWETFDNFGGTSYEDLTLMATIRLNGGAINGMAPTLNAAGHCDTTNLLNWGEPTNPNHACGSYFPIIHIRGNANIQSGGRGQGILLVDGDLDLRGAFIFVGLIIVKGELGVQGGGANGPRITGGVISANQASIEMEDPDGTQSFVGSSIVQNSRCAIRRAVRSNSALSSMRPIASRSWVDLTGTSF